MDFKEIMEYCQATALATKFEPTEASVYRRFCRNYSKKFYTPLPVVLTLDPEHVVLSIYEEQLEDADLENIEAVEKLLDVIYTMQDPEYEGKKEEDLEDFMADAEAEENERLELKQTVTQSLAKKIKKKSESVPEVPKDLPKSGGVNLAYLADSENEG